MHCHVGRLHRFSTIALEIFISCGNLIGLDKPGSWHGPIASHELTTSLLLSRDVFFMFFLACPFIRQFFQLGEAWFQHTKPLTYIQNPSTTITLTSKTHSFPNPSFFIPNQPAPFFQATAEVRRWLLGHTSGQQCSQVLCFSERWWVKRSAMAKCQSQNWTAYAAAEMTQTRTKNCRWNSTWFPVFSVRGLWVLKTARWSWIVPWRSCPTSSWPAGEPWIAGWQVARDEFLVWGKPASQSGYLLNNENTVLPELVGGFER